MYAPTSLGCAAPVPLLLLAAALYLWRARLATEMDPASPARSPTKSSADTSLVLLSVDRCAAAAGRRWGFPTVAAAATAGWMLVRSLLSAACTVVTDSSPLPSRLIATRGSWGLASPTPPSALEPEGCRSGSTASICATAWPNMKSSCHCCNNSGAGTPSPCNTPRLCLLLVLSALLVLGLGGTKALPSPFDEATGAVACESPMLEPDGLASRWATRERLFCAGCAAAAATAPSAVVEAACKESGRGAAPDQSSTSVSSLPRDGELGCETTFDSCDAWAATALT